MHKKGDELQLNAVYTFVAVNESKRVPMGVKLGDPKCPISLDDAPVHARKWALKHGFGKVNSSIYVISEMVIPPSGIPFMHCFDIELDEGDDEAIVTGYFRDIQSIAQSLADLR